MAFLIFIIFIIVAILFLANVRTKNKIFFSISFILILLAGLRPEGLDKDYSNYVEYFYNVDNAFVEYSFKFIVYLVDSLFRNEIKFLFVIYACLGIIIKFHAIKKLTELIWASILIYISYYFMLHEMTQIRIGVSSAFLLLSIIPLYNNNKRYFLLCVICATFFHYSSFIILFLWFIKKGINKNILAILLPICIISSFISSYLFVNIPIPFIQDKMLDYIRLKNTNSTLNNINIFNAIYLTKIIIFYLFYIKYNYISNKNKYFNLIFSIYCLSLCVFPLLSYIPVVAFRISELLGVVEIVLLPMIYYFFKPSLISRMVVIIFSLSFLLMSLFYNKLIVV